MAGQRLNGALGWLRGTLARLRDTAEWLRGAARRFHGTNEWLRGTDEPLISAQICLI